ncbi:DUF1786 domain-containing protein [Salidesulfovibrio onnuriiensis]|uniref:DUF1786 domain-containing protein n=1 Tax=Salidesulfovibrio onnuriiensis TaxID=2583823 RepID=UPI0011C70DB6|nr:DUF1786 domain-containing protein [Salidesulfovibrio onnuriiensis]
MSQTTLCLDIGSGTQDVLLYSPDREVENCPKFVLPSPALQIGKRLAALTAAGKNVWLHGHNMGGGVTRFVRAHLKAGLHVAAQPAAALTMGDDLERVEQSGVALSEQCPDGYEPLLLSDFDEGWWRRFFQAAGLKWPDAIAACAQDHGFHPRESNRKGRFKLWEEFLTTNQGRPEALVFRDPPPMLTRLRELQRCIGGGIVTDTGAAAVLGALFVEEIERESFAHGLTLVNVGNSHVIAFLIFEGRIHGVYEQHTGVVDGAKLWADLELFRTGKLGFEQVFDENGHGCLVMDLPERARGFGSLHVLGPQRALLRAHSVCFPAPGGDMMLAGCFGLVKGMRLLG